MLTKLTVIIISWLKEIKPVNPKGNQSWIFTESTDAEAEALILGPPDVKSWLTRKDPDAKKDWRREERRTTEDETVAWHHRLNRHEFEQTLRDYEGQGSLVCRTPWGCKESDTTEWLNNSKSNYYLVHLCGGLRVQAVWLVRSLFPDQRLNPVSQQWKLRVLTVGQPGKSHTVYLKLIWCCMSIISQQNWKKIKHMTTSIHAINLLSQWVGSTV